MRAPRHARHLRLFPHGTATLCGADGELTGLPAEVTCNVCIGRDRDFSWACDRIVLPDQRLDLETFVDDEVPTGYRVALVQADPLTVWPKGPPPLVHAVEWPANGRFKLTASVRTLCGFTISEPTRVGVDALTDGERCPDGPCRRCQRIARQRRARCLREHEAWTRRVAEGGQP